MKVGAVALLSITGIHGISPAPSRPALVVLHHAGHFLVDRPCPLFIGRQSFRCPDCKLSDRAIQGDQWLWSQMSSQILGSQRLLTTSVLPACRLDDQGNLDRSLRSIDTNMEGLIAKTGVPANGDRDWDVDRDLMDCLVRVGLRQRHPGFKGLCIPGDVSDRRLIGQLKGSGFVRGRSDPESALEAKHTETTLRISGNRRRTPILSTSSVLVPGAQPVP